MSAFRPLPDLLRDHAQARPDKLALTDGDTALTYAELDRLTDRVAASLQRDGLARNGAVAVIAHPSVKAVALFLGTLRAGGVAAPIQPSATPAQVSAMVADAHAAVVFLDAETDGTPVGQAMAVRAVSLARWDDWLCPPDATPTPSAISPDDPFNLLYSSGTTGTPKGIVQSHAMRAAQFAAYAPLQYEAAVTLVATPLYSNTTLVALLPTLAAGGTAVLMRRFDARNYLQLAELHRATHTMLVPVQYQRIMTVPDFGRFDLSAFRVKLCTSAPFRPELKADVAKRWPGVLLEFYGMTEGGGSTVLDVTAHPDKLHTVGVPAPGHDIRLIDEAGLEVAPGEAGEVVGRSGTMMTGYHGREATTHDATWTAPTGERFIRHGDIGRYDTDGFLVLLDRKKDMIISGGFNIYPSDLEAALTAHPAVADAAVIGVPDERWGETPVGFYVPAAGVAATANSILTDVNAQLGRTQRLAGLRPVAELPRSAIGKVLKRELRDQMAAGPVA